MNYQLLEYSCPECGMLFKGELNQDLFTTNIKKECPKCGSILKTLKKVWKQPPQTQELYDKECNSRSVAASSQVPSPSLSKLDFFYQFVNIIRQYGEAYKE